MLNHIVHTSGSNSEHSSFRGNSHNYELPLSKNSQVEWSPLFKQLFHFYVKKTKTYFKGLD